MRLFLYLSLPLFLLDQATKLWITQNFPDPRDPTVANRIIEVIPGFFNLVRVHNTGMAFGMFNGNPYANWIFGAIGIVAVTAIVMFWKKERFLTVYPKLRQPCSSAGSSEIFLTGHCRGVATLSIFSISFCLFTIKFPRNPEDIFRLSM